MTTGTLLAILVAALLVIGAIRLIGPFVYSVVKRARMHGPAPYSAGGGGTATGWGVSLLWAMREKNREESYEYLRETERDLEEDDDHAQDDPLPQRVVAGPAPDAAPPGEAWTEPPVSADGRRWWSGTRWEDSDRFAPAGAHWSEDRSQWWDGVEWRWAPGEFPDRSSLPQKVDWSRGRTDVMASGGGSWVGRRRSERVVPAPPAPDRSDPPPDFLRGADET
jgi:hypothetical protein